MEFTAWSVTLGTQGFAIAPDGTLVTEEIYTAPTYSYQQDMGTRVVKYTPGEEQG